jgi:rhodanese-related sulfurtransferase
MNRSRFSALAAAAALSLSALASCGGPSTPRFEPASIAIYETRGPLTTVDIRSRAAYDRGHLPNAALMEFGVIPDALDETPKEQAIIVYGEGEEGKDEERAAAALTAAGFKKVSVMRGGMAAYAALKLPTRSTAEDEEVREMLEDVRNKPQPQPNPIDMKKVQEQFAEEMRAKRAGQ